MTRTQQYAQHILRTAGGGDVADDDDGYGGDDDDGYGGVGAVVNCDVGNGMLMRGER